MTPRHLSVCRALTLLALFAVSAATQDVPLFEAPPQALAYENDAGRVIAVDAEGALAFDTWNAYFASDFFARHGMHCGQRPLLPVPGAADGSTADCSSGCVLEPRAKSDIGRLKKAISPRSTSCKGTYSPKGTSFCLR